MHPARELTRESAAVCVWERLGALARECTDEDGIEVRQRHDEQRYLGGSPIEDDLGLAEVDLGLAGRVGQRDEDIGMAASPGADGALDDGQSAGIAVLIAVGVPQLPGALRSSSRIWWTTGTSGSRIEGRWGRVRRYPGGSGWVRIFLGVL